MNVQVYPDQKDLWFGGENFLLHRAGRSNKLYPMPGVGAIQQMVSLNDALLFCIGKDTAFMMEKKSGRMLGATLPDIQINQIVKHEKNIWAASLTVS